eukprot:523321_1
MTTFSQPFHQIYCSIVTYYIKTIQKNSLTQLNNNEIADKTAKKKKNGYHQLITQINTHKGHNNYRNSSKIKNTNEEQNKCPMTIIWNNHLYYSNQSVDPPPDQPISSNIII